MTEVDNKLYQFVEVFRITQKRHRTTDSVCSASKTTCPELQTTCPGSHKTIGGIEMYLPYEQCSGLEIKVCYSHVSCFILFLHLFHISRVLR